MNPPVTLEMRAARHAALGDPARLAIVDELSVSDRAPVELRRRLGMESNLLAHHLDVLERVGLIERSRSSGDGRRRYVHLLPDALDGLAPGRPRPAGAGAVRVHARTRPAPSSPPRCGARRPASRPTSAGTHPADAGASRRRRRRPPGRTRPRRAPPRTTSPTSTSLPALVITVCDRAHEELDARRRLAALVDPRSGARSAPKAAFDADRGRAARPDRTARRAGGGVMTDELHPSDVELGRRGRDRHRRAPPRPRPAASPPRRSAPAC